MKDRTKKKYEDIKEIIKKSISKVGRIDIKLITDTNSLRNEFMIDSLQAIQIAAIIEKEFNIKFDEIEILNVDNVKEIADLIIEYTEKENL